MRKTRKKILAAFAAVAIGITLLVGLTAGHKVQAAAEPGAGRILFISSYSYAWEAVQIQIEGIKQGIDERTVLDFEFMDTKRVDDETAYQLFYDGLAYRLSQVDPYDAVILGDDAALQFALKYREDLFAGIPLIFEGVNDEDLAREAVTDPLITGVLEKLSVDKNIELALTLYPNAKKVVAVLDDTLTGQAERKNFYAYADDYPDLLFTEINTSQLETTRIKSELSRLEEDAILIYVIMTEDASGKKYSNKEAVEMIYQFSNVPAFRMVEGGIEFGVLGGNIASMERSGQIAAEIAMDIINGTRDLGNIGGLVESPNIYCINETVLKKFNISKSDFPEETVFINHVPTFFEKNRDLLVPGLIILAILLVAIGYVFIDNIRRRKLMGELEEARSYLENASQHDFLTGLPNRSKFMADLQETVGARTPCTVIMLDIDNFKGINDNYGHVIGDEALKQVAARLKALKTNLFQAYRFAGDEFILILKSDNRKIMETSAMQCLEVFQKPYKLMGTVHNIHGSIGVASYPKDADEGDQLIVCADEAMYTVKQHGKNAYAFYDKMKKDEVKQ